MRAWRFLTLCGLAMVSTASAGPAQAGFFDEVGEMFWGRGARSYERPLSIKVHPRRHRSRAPRIVKERSKPEAVKAAEIDPGKDPQWFLHDPTLRSGDIVVLKTGVFVFDGSRSAKTHDHEDFVSLKDARQVPKSTRLLVEAIATVPSRTSMATATAE